MMRILTVKQPWAWAIIHGGKDVENRVRNLAGNYRGPVAIHAGLTVDTSAQGHWPIRDLIPSEAWRARGVIIGVVDLVDVLPPTYYDEADSNEAWCSEWAQPGCHQLVLEEPRPLAEPIPYKGSLGMRTMPDDVERQILAAVKP